MAPGHHPPNQNKKRNGKDAVQTQKGLAVPKKEVPKEINYMNKPLWIRFNPDWLKIANEQINIILKKVMIYAIPVSGEYREYNGKIRLHWVIAFEVDVKQGKPAWYVVVDTKMFQPHVKKYQTKALPVEINIQKKSYDYHERSPNESRFECSLKPNNTLNEVYNLIQDYNLLNYRYSKDGNGCFHWTKVFFNAMIEEKEWFKSEDEAKEVKKGLESFEKNQLIGKDYIIAGDKGEFFDEEV